MDVEVKVLIPDKNWEKVQKHISKDHEVTKREIWFFETTDLSLKQHEIVLRARINRKKGKVESTTKWRRWVSPFAVVLGAWEELPGFKAEVDASLTEGVPAWSITDKDLEENLFRAVIKEKKPIEELFNKNQRFLVESAWPRLPWNNIKSWGPIVSVKWEVSNEISIERWTIGENSIIEISKRGPNQNAVLDEIRQWLSKDGLEMAALEGGKTAWALTNLIRDSA